MTLNLLLEMIKNWKLVEPFEIELDIVIALIYRTVNHFKENITENALKRMNGLFTQAGITNNDSSTRVHYHELGWFLSICNRIAGYSLGNFEYSKELARLNAHAMGWHPSIINEKFVNYFTALKEEKSMLKCFKQYLKISGRISMITLLVSERHGIMKYKSELCCTRRK